MKKVLNLLLLVVFFASTISCNRDKKKEEKKIREHLELVTEKEHELDGSIGEEDEFLGELDDESYIYSNVAGPCNKELNELLDKIKKARKSKRESLYQERRENEMSAISDLEKLQLLEK